MGPDDLAKHIAWLRHEDICAFLASDEVASPWFSAFRIADKAEGRLAWFSALVPLDKVARLINKRDIWDVHIGDGGPSIWSSFSDGVETSRYASFGNEEGIEPLVLRRYFHGIRDECLELAQEFRLYYNLFHEHGNRRHLLIDDNGDESEAARYGEGHLEIRTDLLLKFCAVKQFALAIYVDSFRDTPNTLDDLGLAEVRRRDDGPLFAYNLSVVAMEPLLKKGYKTSSRIVGKKYVPPGAVPNKRDQVPEQYQEFIIGTDKLGNPLRFNSDPEKLGNYFGKNPNAPHYLTPVFFRSEVLAKYYADPRKYSVEDGYLRCGGLWGVRIDNDHTDVVVVFLGDLGRDLSEAERNYWLSYNVAPDGRKISQTTFKRGFLAEFADPKKPDLLFKHEYHYFCRDFRDAKGWDFFLPLHDDDEHFLTGLRIPSKENQAEFDSQLIALTKVLVDSLNEKELAKKLKTLVGADKGITKLEKFFVEGGATGYESHVKFLRVLQDLRSKSAAHRKGSSYEKLIADLQLKDEGQQKVFSSLLSSGIELLKFIRNTLLPKEAV